jgi:hypothetical protein
MSITKNTQLNKIEVTEDNILQVRFAKQIVEGDSVLNYEWHRCGIASVDAIDLTIGAVNTDLANMGYPEVNPVDIAKIKAIALAVWPQEESEEA